MVESKATETEDVEKTVVERPLDAVIAETPKSAPDGSHAFNTTPSPVPGSKSSSDSRLPSADHFGGTIEVPVAFYNQKREIFKRTESCVNASRTIFMLGALAMAVSLAQKDMACAGQALIYMVISGSALLCPTKSWAELYGATIVDEQQPVQVQHKLQVYFNNVSQWGLLCQLQLVFTLIMAGAFYLYQASDPLAMIVAGLCAAVSTGWLFVLIHDRI